MSGTPTPSEPFREPVVLRGTHTGDGFSASLSTRPGFRVCRICSAAYECTDSRSHFCSKKCKATWFNFWKAKGPALARAMYDYRITRRKDGLSDLCHTFAVMYDDFQQRRRDENVK